MNEVDELLTQCQGYEIQAKYFRIGPRTRLWIDPCTVDGYFKWRFDFQDLGSFYYIEESVPINTIPVNNPAAFVFGKRFRSFVRELHADMLGPGCMCTECDLLSPSSTI